MAIATQILLSTGVAPADGTSSPLVAERPMELVGVVIPLTNLSVEITMGMEKPTVQFTEQTATTGISIPLESVPLMVSRGVEMLQIFR